MIIYQVMPFHQALSFWEPRGGHFLTLFLLSRLGRQDKTKHLYYPLYVSIRSFFRFTNIVLQATITLV